MNIPECYDYLRHSRRDLWACLEGVPDEVLARPVLPGGRFHCIKDLVAHIPAVEDSWIHEDILLDTPVWDTVAAMVGAQDGPFYADFALTDLLDYWRQVEASTLVYLARLSPGELARPVAVGPRRDRHFTADALLWHVLIHEMRHTAQIAVVLRQAGVPPPTRGLLDFMPSVEERDRISSGLP